MFRATVVALAALQDEVDRLQQPRRRPTLDRSSTSSSSRGQERDVVIRLE